MGNILLYLTPAPFFVIPYSMASLVATSDKPLNRLGDKRGLHPNSLKNLKPGDNGLNHNLDGYSLKSALKHSLNEPLKKPDKDAPARDLVVYSTIEGAILREPTPFKEVWDRVEGKVPDKHAIIGDIVLRIVDDDDSNSSDS